MDIEHSPEYKQSLGSKHWQQLRAVALQRSSGKCERCGTPEGPVRFALHHNTYERLGRERWSDVELLCDSCHAIADKDRENETRERQAERLHDARFSGWMRKKHGDDWADRCSDGDVEDEYDRFQEWLERRDY